LEDLREQAVCSIEAGVLCGTTTAKFEVSVSFMVKLMQRGRL
jgi:hypothetical protein